MHTCRCTPAQERICCIIHLICLSSVEFSFAGDAQLRGEVGSEGGALEEGYLGCPFLIQPESSSEAGSPPPIPFP